MQIAVLGTGYVGLVSGADYATRGVAVTCVDVDVARIEGLQRGVMPFFEPELESLVQRAVAAGMLRFTTDAAAAMQDADVVISAVGTPLGEDGHADLRAVFNVARAFAVHAPAHAVLVNKSTVPVGTAARCVEIVGNRVVSNPEFLSQGSAVRDTAHPTRIVIGTLQAEARAVLRRLNAAFIEAGVPYVEMSAESAEMVKCASNAFLATKISFINEIANYCSRVGGDIHDVARAMGLDPRIGSAFLRAGLGYGGGCLSKDVGALIAAGHDAGYDFRILPQVQAVNDSQKFVLYERMRALLGGLRGKRVAIWGLSFKPGTDDLRNAPSLAIIERLLADGAEVIAYDPQAMPRMRARFPAAHYAQGAVEAVQGADALCVLTEWDVFARVPLADVAAAMRTPMIFDGRGVLGDAIIPDSLRYFTIGRG